jgi:transposase
MMNLLSEAHIRKIYDQGADAIVRLVHRLAGRIDELEVQPIRAPQPVIASLSKELARAKRTLTRQSQELLALQQLNHQLLRRIRELEHEVERGAPVARDSHNSSLPPSADPPWQKVLRTRSLRRKSGLKVGGQHGHPGATLRQSPRPDHRITHAARACPGCGFALDETDAVASERRQVFDLPPVHLVVTEHCAETRRCRRCGAEAQAAFPAGVRAPAQYGSAILSRAAYLNLYQLLPVARTSEALSDLFGGALSPATIERAGRLFSGKLVRSEQRLKAALRDSAVVGADETGMRAAGRGGWVHVARTDDLTHFAYDSRRGLDAMQEVGILPQFRGTLVRDGYLSYTRFECCHHSLCNAHLLRDLIFVEELSLAQKVWTEPLAALLLEIKGAATQARTDGESQLSEETKSAYLRRYSRLVKKADKLNPHPLAEEDNGGDAPQRKRPPLSPSRRLVNRLLRRRDEVLRFMTDLAVPFTNNGAERDLRMLKVRQKVSGCFRTEGGARNFCRVRSYLSTARKQGHPLLSALERVLSGKPLAFSTAAGAG